MKITKETLSKSCQILLALACFVTISFTACEKDDDKEPSPNEVLVGTWVRQYNDGSETVTEEYEFLDHGSTDDSELWHGEYKNSYGASNYIFYQVTSPGFVYMQIVPKNPTSWWEDEKGYTFRLDGNRLYFGDYYTSQRGPFIRKE